MARRLRSRDITVNCCHPGAVATNMGVNRETGFGRAITSMLKPFFLTPMEGAATAIYLATDEAVEDITGEYFYRKKIARSSKLSQNMNLARKLYRFSEKLIRQAEEQ